MAQTAAITPSAIRAAFSDVDSATTRLGSEGASNVKRSDGFAMTCCKCRHRITGHVGANRERPKKLYAAIISINFDWFDHTKLHTHYQSRANALRHELSRGSTQTPSSAGNLVYERCPEKSFERPGPPSPNTRSATRESGMASWSDAPRRRTLRASTFLKVESIMVVL